MKQVRIPEDRIGVIIGEGGETKQDFEELTDCEVKIEGNVVKVEGEAFDELMAEKAVKAVGRGFNPDKALQLVEKDVGFHIINIKDFTQNSSRQEELKGRVIGRDGETRRHIEKEANIDLSVYGTTVALIGKGQNIQVAVEALNMLLNGSTHSTAYDYLERNQSKIVR
ncbi:KH domain-containing protein [Candidatus Nanohalococcus occultus]|uniref:rRNA processing protein Krr1/Pno1, contains KH domain n=1 Tax=Candidatus Nanohalococcus occultus TaxID=2978047 RepID=A0ABY8CJ01_9ARCH|nr:rRNA processing protein Krr1/Pno1, contains KH domain [Candidatus Nanohaloarchaeota archaeon SVXNc]